MQLYWKCEECDESNAYPQVKICETCGAPMTPAAEQRVLREQKEAERRQAQIKQEQERRLREAQRAKLEAEKKRQEALKAAKQAEEERKRIERLKKAMLQKEAREEKIVFVLRKCSRVACGIIRTFAALAVVVSVALFFQNMDNMNLERSLNGLSNRLYAEYLAHTIVDPDEDFQDGGAAEETSGEELDVAEKRVSRVMNKVRIQFTSLLDVTSSNIRNRFDNIKSILSTDEDTSAQLDGATEYVTGDVE